MRLSRPVALGILALIAILLLWLMLNQSQQGDGPDPTPTSPTVTQDSPSPRPTGPAPTEDEFETFDAGGEEEGDAGNQGSEEASPTQASGSAYPEENADGPVGVDTRDWDDIDACYDDELPRELEPVTDDIEAGGPFEYAGKDGSTFQNREGLLPDERRGYYREYTVETPGSHDRGARRIVTGGGETDPEVWYYTDDHYRSFCEFAP